MTPYGNLLKLAVQSDPAGGPDLVALSVHEGVIGRPGFLHGGAIAGLCEYAAFTALRAALDDASVVMKPITVTVDYLRGGKLEPSFARAEIVRLGRRIANIEVRAWQAEEARPIALARLNFLLERRVA